MGNDVELRKPDALARHAITVDEVRAQVAIIHNVMKSVMQKGVHYGTIPGCGDKPTLLKPGAEVIMTTFRLAADPVIEDLSSNDECRYRVKVGITSSSGLFLGAGVGECSSDEEKYRWKRPTCDEEWQEAEVDRRREKWARGRDGKGYKIKQVRTSVADVANTVLKMAKKRALVDAILTCTAASDIFTQDIDDMPTWLAEAVTDTSDSAGKPEVKPPQAKTKKQPPQPAPAKPQSEDDEIRAKLRTVLQDLAGSPDADITDLTEQYSGFKGNNDEIKAEGNIDNLKEAWLRSTYGKAKKDWELAGFGTDTKEHVAQ